MKAIARMTGTIVLLLLIWAGAAQAQLTIEITRGVTGALPIAVVPFRTEPGVTQPPDGHIAAIVRADLQRSGRFSALSPQQFPALPDDFSSIDLPSWRQLKADYMVVGHITPAGDNTSYNVQFQLVDVFQGSQLMGQAFTVQPGQLRALAHHISDLIYQRLTGERGVFSTRIAYISAQQSPTSSLYMLSVADADGYNSQVVLRSDQPVMSPAWSPDGRQLAYVSFEHHRSQIVVQNLYTGERRVVSAEPGINGAPAWSPDGSRLALTLSRDGNPEIYILELASGSLRRLTNNSAIDTEPTWSPDGHTIVFTSDRGGSPQLYRVAISGGTPQRLTFNGNYNARPEFSPDGRQLALVHRVSGGQFRIALLDLASGQLHVLTAGRLDESPSFAPNGRMIIYGTIVGERGVLAVVSVDGKVRQQLQLAGSQLREPAWSPFGN